MKRHLASLSWRLPLLVVLALAVTLVFAVFVGWVLQRDQVFRDAEQLVRQDAARLVRRAEKQWVSEPLLLQREVVFSAAERGNGVAALLDQDGVVRFAHHTDWVGQPAAQVFRGWQTSRFEHARDGLQADAVFSEPAHFSVMMSFPLPAPEGSISPQRGVVVVEADLSWQLSQLLGRELWLRWPSALVGIFAACALALWLSLRVGRPLRQLAEVAAALSAGQAGPKDFDTLPRNTPREIQELATALRAMTHKLRETSHELQDWLDSGGALVWLSAPTNERVFFNQSWLTFTGRSLHSELGRGWMAHIDPRDRERVLQVLGQAYAAQQPFSVDYRLLNVRGEYCWVQDVGRPRYDSQGHYVGFLGNCWDVSERKQTETRLRQLSLAVEQSPDSIIITDPEGRIEYVNDSFVTTTGYSREEVLGRNPAMLSAGRTPASVYRSLWTGINRGDVWEGELVNRHKNGSEFVQRAVISPIRDGEGHITHYLGVQQDITERKKAEEKIHALAYFDALTGLPNRTFLLERLEQLLEDRSRRGARGLLMLLNIDRFKHVNDARGQAYGDALLVAVSQRLRAKLPNECLLGRMSADEFGCLWVASEQGRDTPQDQWAVQVLLALQPDLEVEGDRIQVSASVGVSLFDSAYTDTVLDVLRQADTALHHTKRGGGNGYAFYESHMTDSARQRFELQRELQVALEEEQFVMYLQPQVDAQGQTVAAEALVRWQHPVRGMVSPGLFIPVAEDTGQIVALGDWVLAQACHLLGRLERQGQPMRISVNVSPRQFAQPQFVDQVRHTLLQAGASPQWLTLEVTEGLVINDMKQVAAKMNALATLGVMFSVDDFGTGYSNLSYMKQLPLSELKIDQAFVREAPDSPNDAALVETMVSMARHMGLKVVAEGVETERQADFLRQRGADLLQGYLFGRPQSVSHWLQEWGIELLETAA